MSKLEDLVVSLETAKRLVEVGIEVDSVFSWCEHAKAVISYPDLRFTWDNRTSWTQYPAPAFEELPLEDPIEYRDNILTLDICKSVKNEWVVRYLDNAGNSVQPLYFCLPKLSDAGAEILIALKKEDNFGNNK